MKIAAIGLAALLAGCLDDSGESWGPYQDVAGPVASSITDSVAIPITHNFTAPGSYQLQFSGEASCAGTGPVTFGMTFSFSGMGRIRLGNISEEYDLSACPQTITLQEKLVLDLEGSGPWIIQILLVPVEGSATISLSDATLAIRTPT